MIGAGNVENFFKPASAFGPDDQAAYAAKLHGLTATVFEPNHPIRTGFLSRLPLEIVAEAAAFPDLLRPVQVGDNGTTISATGRGALAVHATEPDGREP